MSEIEQKQLGNVLWGIANELRGPMNPDDFRDYMLSFIFLKYLSSTYEEQVKKELGDDISDTSDTPLKLWYEENPNDIKALEAIIKRRIHYIIEPKYLWSNIISLSKNHSSELLTTLRESFKYIENKSFQNSFIGLFSEINLDSEKLGKNYTDRNKKLCVIISKISYGISRFRADDDILGDAYEYLIGEFAAGGAKKAGEFYTPQKISTILSSIVVLDGQDPTSGEKNSLDSVFDFACGSGSLLLNVRNKLQSNEGQIGKIYGQEINITTYNLCRMNMILHGVKDTEFELYHGDTLTNDWHKLKETNPSKKLKFDAIVANPPFSYRWDSNEAMANDFRFKNYALAPKSAADFAFVLHGLHYLSKEGTMAIVLPHGVLFRGGSELNIRTKLLDNDYIDTVIGLAPNLFFSTGIPVCILVLKKCKKYDDVLFINASGEENFQKNKRQNSLRDTDIEKIVDTYKHRTIQSRYSKRVSIEEIKQNDYNLNISRYISIAKPEPQIDIQETNKKLEDVEKNINKHKKMHNKFLKELGLKLLV